MQRILKIVICTILIFSMAGCSTAQPEVNSPTPTVGATETLTKAPTMPPETTDIPDDTEIRPALESRLDVEAEIDSLTGGEGNIYYNPDEKYAHMVNNLLYQAKETALKGSIIVATDDEVIFTSGTRLQDIDGNEVTPYSIYEIGSMTKSFTAVCTMKLIEEGKLSMEDTLAKLFPEYSYCPNFEKAGSVSVYDMLHMRSGIYDFINESDKFFTPELFAEICDENYLLLSPGERMELFFSAVDEKKILECLFTIEMKNEPDTVYAYCNTNYYLLSLIIEKLTGKAYEEILREQIFEPCGMNSTSSMTEGDVTASIKADAWYFLPSYTKGAGDIHSNVVDMLKYHRALFGGYLLKEESMKELLTPVDGYACGWFADGDVYSHGGNTTAFCTKNYVLERDGRRLYIMMFSNPKDNRGDALLGYMKNSFQP